MNIFVLSTDPEQAARMQCDKHVVKMPLENAQMLCSAAHKVHGHPVVYRPTHPNHPCTLWAAETTSNYEWFIEYSYALFDEYTKRYGRKHKSSLVAFPAAEAILRDNIPSGPLTPFAQCLGKDAHLYTDPDAVKAYRSFYMGDKAAFAAWDKCTPAPKWWTL
jgi:hypothetical protein